jgi:S1-C subfamily serine protease
MWKSRRGIMRNSMSDERYEQYLEASGFPTSVMIDNVLNGSAAESAGLRPGDEIVRYGSERVFDERDLMMAIIQGEPGDSVTIEVRRDGAIFHVAVARGPLGTSRMARMFGGF